MALLHCRRAEDLTKEVTTRPVLDWLDSLFRNKMIFTPHPFQCFGQLRSFVGFRTQGDAKLVAEAIKQQTKTWVSVVKMLASPALRQSFNSYRVGLWAQANFSAQTFKPAHKESFKDQRWAWEKSVRAEKRDRDAEREKETFRRQRHHQSDRSWAVCVHLVIGSLSLHLYLSSPPLHFFSRSPLVFKTLFENACELQWVVLYLKEPAHKARAGQRAAL